MLALYTHYTRGKLMVMCTAGAS